MSFRRNHDCGALTGQNIGEKVSLSGWVHRRRDHGGLIFIDLRDRFGLTQVVFRPEINQNLLDMASQLRSEWVISIKGMVISRGVGMMNPKLKTGEVEVEVHELDILSKAKTPPFSISDDSIQVNEELRLKYRYLDMRRGDIAEKLALRHLAMLTVRNYLNSQKFLEISTPFLAKSTPEGSRDYLVPSRIYPGSFMPCPNPSTFQTDSDDRRHGSLLSNCELFPR